MYGKINLPIENLVESRIFDSDSVHGLAFPDPSKILNKKVEKVSKMTKCAEFPTRPIKQFRMRETFTTF